MGPHRFVPGVHLVAWCRVVRCCWDVPRGVPAVYDMPWGSLLAAAVDRLLAYVSYWACPSPACPLIGTLVSYPDRLARCAIMASKVKSGLY